MDEKWNEAGVANGKRTKERVGLGGIGMHGRNGVEKKIE